MAERKQSQKGGNGGGRKAQGSGGSQAGGQSGRGQQQGGSSDLKQREYKDKEGNVHHHTREYMERNKGSKGGS